MAINRTEEGRVAYLYTGSTVPEFWGRGVRSALRKTQLRDARKAGCVYATGQVVPKNNNCKNTERAAFKLAHIRA